MRLTDEEIVDLNANCIEVMGRPLTKGEALKAGSRAQLKKVVEYLKPNIYCIPDDIPKGVTFVAVNIKAIEALLDEVKE